MGCLSLAGCELVLNDMFMTRSITRATFTTIMPSGLPCEWDNLWGYKKNLHMLNSSFVCPFLCVVHIDTKASEMMEDEAISFNVLRLGVLVC